MYCKARKLKFDLSQYKQIVFDNRQIMYVLNQNFEINRHMMQ